MTENFAWQKYAGEVRRREMKKNDKIAFVYVGVCLSACLYERANAGEMVECISRLKLDSSLYFTTRRVVGSFSQCDSMSMPLIQTYALILSIELHYYYTYILCGTYNREYPHKMHCFQSQFHLSSTVLLLCTM